VNDEIEILPDIVIIFLMEVKAFICVSVKFLLVDVTDEATIFHIFVTGQTLVSELRERINNNTEDDIQQNCDHKQEKCEIDYSSEIESLNIFCGCCLSWKELSNTTSTSNSIIDSGKEAMHHSHTNRVSFHVQNTVMDVIIIISLIHKNKANSRVNVDDDHSKHSCHKQLVSIERNTLNDILQLREPVL
jgi:hypothetical protein